MKHASKGLLLHFSVNLFTDFSAQLFVDVHAEAYTECLLVLSLLSVWLSACLSVVMPKCCRHALAPVVLRHPSALLGVALHIFYTNNMLFDHDLVNCSGVTMTVMMIER